MQFETYKTIYLLDYKLEFSNDTVRRCFDNKQQVESYIKKHRLKDRVQGIFKIEKISIK